MQEGFSRRKEGQLRQQIVLFFFTSKSVSSLYWLIGIFAIVFGVMMFARFVQIKSAMDTAPTATA